jgi:hypothetical protein
MKQALAASVYVSSKVHAMLETKLGRYPKLAGLRFRHSPSFKGQKGSEISCSVTVYGVDHDLLRYIASLDCPTVTELLRYHQLWIEGENCQVQLCSYE